VGLFRRVSTRRLVSFLAAAVLAAVAAGIAVAASGGSGSSPPAKALPDAVHDALTAPPLEGVSGTLIFTNRLLGAGALASGGSSPLAGGASGRFWVTAGGHARLELQSADGSGDVQLLYDGSSVELYDGASNTVYRAQLPQAAGDQSGSASQTPPTVAQIQNGLDKLAGAFTISGATPTTVADQGAYLVRLSPKTNGGLFGAAEVAWDALHGVPLRLAVYAVGDSTPVLELTATQIAYGPVSPLDVQIALPSDVHVVDLGTIGGGSSDAGSAAAPVTGVAAVAAQLPFALVAPDSLAGQSRTEVRLVQVDGSPAALVTYGQGLGSVALLEGQQKAHAGGGSGLLAGLPSVSLASSVSGTELATALGTVVRFDKGGVAYTVAASQPTSTVVDAARSIAG
jgi:outer membrane lipoprotein-sorting protein